MKLQTLRVHKPSSEVDYNEVGNPDPSVIADDLASQDKGPPINPDEQPSFPELMAEIVEEGNEVVRELRDQSDDELADKVGNALAYVPVDPASVEQPGQLGQPTSGQDDAAPDDNAPIADMSEELYWAEVRLAGSMAEIERERIALEAEIQKHKEAVQKADGKLKKCEAELHDAKESHKSATERLLGLARKLVEITQEKKLPTEEEMVRLEAGPDDGWRLASTKELLTKAKIKGLSQKKIEILHENLPTLGHLEDARGLASKEGVPYQKKLPKGIGQQVADAIEQVQEDYLREWTRRQDDPARAKLADELLAECRELVSEWQAADCVPKPADDEHLHAGHTAFGDGVPFTGFLSDDRVKAKQWITGWVMAERGKRLGTEKAG